MAQEYFFDTIIRKAYERPITTADFAEFVGCSNWLLVERSDMHFDWQRRHENDLFDADCDVVVEFWLRRVFDNGKVEIVADNRCADRRLGRDAYRRRRIGFTDGRIVNESTHRTNRNNRADHIGRFRTIRCSNCRIG